MISNVRRNVHYSLIRFACAFLYALSNPFRLCRKFFETMQEPEAHMYGETPISAWKRIIIAADLQSKDHFMDLGCGRGLLCFWSYCLVRCRTTGIDWVPPFILRAQLLGWLFRIRHVQFLCSRISYVTLSQATVVYLYTYHREEEQVDFSQLPQGARVITVSEPLNQEGFFLKNQLSVDYPWGTADVFISVKN